MTDDDDKTKPTVPEFDFSAYPENTLFHDRRTGRERRGPGEGPGKPRPDGTAPTRPVPERRARAERRKRIDPTTFEKQYTEEEIEFMNAMQRFKERTGKSFPTYGDVIKVAVSLGYLRLVDFDQVLPPSEARRNSS
jgi:hypothetical protein